MFELDGICKHISETGSCYDSRNPFRDKYKCIKYCPVVLISTLQQELPDETEETILKIVEDMICK